MNKKTEPVGVWAESMHSLYSAKPIVEYYLSRGEVVKLFTFERNKLEAEKYIDPRCVVVAIENVDSILLYHMFGTLKKILSNGRFSNMYRRIVGRRNGTWNRLLSLFSICFDERKVNERLHSIFSVFKSRLDCGVVVSLSRVSRPYLLCADELYNISVVESWDHPVKSPFYFVPDCSLTWNHDLKIDLENYQNFNNVQYIRPLKLRYIDERIKKHSDELLEGLPKGYKEELKRVEGKTFVLYPTSTSSVNPLDHLGEMDLIRDLVSAAEIAGLCVYIKPKPNGPVGDYDEFLSCSNVIVGAYATGIDSRDMLDEYYHTFRYLLLKKSYVVVNVATTFVLEAALAGVSVLQLNLNDKRYGHFSSFSKNIHLEKYLLSRPNFPFDGCVKELANSLFSERNSEFSRSLNSWLRRAGEEYELPSEEGFSTSFELQYLDKITNAEC